MKISSTWIELINSMFVLVKYIEVSEYHEQLI